jgi:hypothetical protein
LQGVVPVPLYDVRSVVIPAALDGDCLAAAPADDSDFADAEVYDIPVLVGLNGLLRLPLARITVSKVKAAKNVFRFTMY